MVEKSHKFVSCEHCGVRKDSLFKDFCNHDLDNLEASKTCSFYKKNQSIFLEGSTPRGVFCLNEGKVKIYTRGEEGKEQIIHVAKEGEVVGFRAMFSGEPYRVSAESLEDCNICYISKANFLDMLDSNLVLRNRILKELSIELAERATFITNLAQKPVKERLAFSLIFLNDIYNGDMINLSREDLANFVGTATETLIRLLKDFKEDELIKTHARKIEIINKEEILRLSGG
tara:strand:+ start:12139 stop:12828 length:690 start_codon:yes stop_codon:yes gene_type:complete